MIFVSSRLLIRVDKHSYCSTPKFFKMLTDLSESLTVRKDKEESLKEGLERINKHLPSFVYVPFVTQSLRNYCILNINVSETKVFQTKERVPFMISVELARADEIYNSRQLNDDNISLNSINEADRLNFDIDLLLSKRMTIVKKKVQKKNTKNSEDSSPQKQDHIHEELKADVVIYSSLGSLVDPDV